MSRAAIIKNSLWGNLNVISRYVLSFVAVTLIAAQYGPAEFGIYNLAMTYISFFEGLNLIAPSHLKNRLTANPKELGVVVYSWILNSLFMLVCLVVFLIYFYFTEFNRALFWLTAIFAIKCIFKIFEYSQLALEAVPRADLTQKNQIMSIGSLNLFRTLAAYFKTSLPIVAVGSIVQGLVLTLAGFYESRKLKLKFKPVKDFLKFKEYVKEGIPLTVAVLMTILQSRFFTISIAEKMSLENFGAFQLLIKIIEPIISLSIVIMGTNYTLLVKTLVDSKKRFRSRFLKISLLVIIASIIMSAVLLFIPEWILVKMFGEVYRPIFQLLWLGPAVVITNVAFNLLAQYDTLLGKYKLVAVNNTLILGLYLAAFYVYSDLDIKTALYIYILSPVCVLALNVVLKTIFFFKKTQ